MVALVKATIATVVMFLGVASSFDANACSCGDEKCSGGKVQRCMAGGGGSCTWYPTNQVCHRDDSQATYQRAISHLFLTNIKTTSESTIRNRNDIHSPLSFQKQGSDEITN